MSGMLMGIKLLKSGIDNFQIYERAASVGGTWRENRYPGVACDVASFAYCYEFEPNPNWSRRFSPGSEIYDYFVRTAEKYQLLPHIRFNTEITRAEFRQQRWHIESRDSQAKSADGETEQAEFDLLIAATGPLQKKKYPTIEGLETFSGQRLHTADWDENCDLSGKKIGVIGTGSSAVQMIEPLSLDAENLYVFQRTAQWIMPTANIHYSRLARWSKRKLPALGWLTRKFYDLIGDLFSKAAIRDGWQRRYIDKTTLKNLNSVNNPELRKKLTPDHRAMCKRMIMSDSYYPAIQRDNVELLTENILRINADGVVVDDGSEHGRTVALDTLITATGFYPNAWGIETVIGEHGLSLSQAWQRGDRSYRSITMPGFPNFFMLIGPNSPIANLSLIDIADIGADYIMQCLEKIRRGEIHHLAPNADISTTFHRDLTAAFSDTRWVSGCNSWYLEGDGVPATWPWPPAHYRSALKKPELDDYDIQPA